MADLQGNGVPTTTTIGKVDDYYTDLNTGLKYQLVRILNRELYKEAVFEYIWELLPPWEQRGPQGTAGGYYVPSVDTEGNISWTPSDPCMPSVPSSNIRGPAGEDGSVADSIVKFEITGTTSSKSSSELYADIKAGKLFYCIATLSSSPDGYNGEIICYPSYPFSADRVTLFSIGELPQHTGGKLSYRILYIEGTEVTVHDRGTIWNLSPDDPETT